MNYSLRVEAVLQSSDGGLGKAIWASSVRFLALTINKDNTLCMGVDIKLCLLRPRSIDGYLARSYERLLWLHPAIYDCAERPRGRYKSGRVASGFPLAQDCFI